VLGTDPFHPARFTGRGLERMASLPVLEELKLNYGAVGDAVAPTLQRCPRLRNLAITRAPITAAGVRILATMPSLVFLSLEECDTIKDDALAALADRPLQRLSVRGSAITLAGAEAFKKAQPGCDFHHTAK
jgi:hypothetical protein